MPSLAGMDGHPFRWGRALLWALSWGIGAALGVALGAYLTVVGETGAPGIEGIDPGTDLILLPVITLAVVTAAHLTLQIVRARVRGRRRPVS